jgi:hypothetical protein
MCDDVTADGTKQIGLELFFALSAAVAAAAKWLTVLMATD